MSSNVNPTALTNPMTQLEIKYLTDKSSLSNLIICTSFWDSVTPIKGQRIAAMLDKYLADLVNQGARIEHMKTGAYQFVARGTDFLRTILRSDPGVAENIPRPDYSDNGYEDRTGTSRMAPM
jgi:hypothetical protein